MYQRTFGTVRTTLSENGVSSGIHFPQLKEIPTLSQAEVMAEQSTILLDCDEMTYCRPRRVYDCAAVDLAESSPLKVLRDQTGR